MRQSLFNSFILLFAFLFSSLAFSQTETVFSSSEVMRLRIEGAWSELLKQRFFAPEVAKQARIPVKVVIENKDKTETLIYGEVGLLNRSRTISRRKPLQLPRWKFTAIR